MTLLLLTRTSASGTRVSNGGRKISIKPVQKKRFSVVEMRWNLAWWLRTTYSTRKCKNMTYQKSDPSGTFKTYRLYWERSRFLCVAEIKWVISLIVNAFFTANVSSVRYILTQHWLGIFCKARHFVFRKILRTLYYSLIDLPLTSIGNIIWINRYSSRLESIKSLQKMFIRIIAFSDYREHTNPLFNYFSIWKNKWSSFIYVSLF